MNFPQFTSMNSTLDHVAHSPPIRDDNYAKTASLLKLIASKSPSSSEFIRDENSNESSTLSSRGTLIPFPPSFEDDRPTQPVELQVSNLDQNIDQREMKKMITNIFREHVPILHVSVFFQSDGNMAACVRVPSHQDAQYAISQLHRKKIGFKRILISYSHGQGHNPILLRSKVIALLSEVPGGRLQLFKFREMYEKRYHDSIGVSDLYKMKDVVAISEEQSGRMVQLHYQWCQQPSANTSMNSTVMSANQTTSIAPNELFLDSTICPIHSSTVKDETKGWAERETGAPLPNVIIGMSVLAPNVKNLIKSHGGSLPLSTMTTCYEAEFEAFNVNNDEGVPLEHLVSAIRGVSIQTGPTSGVKILVPFAPHDSAPENNCGASNHEESSLYGQLRTSLSQFSGSTNSLNSLSTCQPAAPLAGQLALFSRELVDLLKTTTGCRMPFHKFIPMYHHHFGRQCRVADYGYTKLKDLFEALPHVVQILGEGSRAMITLAHKAQVKRFTSDLLKVLKTQPAKQLALYDLPAMFEKAFHKTFKINDYGVCEIEDILTEVSETSVVLSSENSDGTDDLIISIPKREQTSDEVERTQKFAEECVELLRHVPDCRLPFNKFIPAYHHHFGRQCRVADYGFTKLIELFEAIPTTIEITEDADGERILQLTDPERLNVVGEQISHLIRNHCSAMRRGAVGQNLQSIKLVDLSDLYLRQYGYALRPDNYGQTSLKGVIEKLNQVLRLDNVEQEDPNDMMVRLIDRSFVKALSLKVKDILAESNDGKMPLESLLLKFEAKHQTKLTLEQLRNDLADLISITDENPDEQEAIVELVPLQLCAVRIRNLLKDFNDKILISEFEAAFAEKYNTPLCPGQYGFPGLTNLISSLPDNFVVRGRGTRKMICYVRDGRGSLPNSNGMSSRGNFTVSGGRPNLGQQSSISTRYSTPRYEGFRLQAPPASGMAPGLGATGRPTTSAWGRDYSSSTRSLPRSRPIPQQNSQIGHHQQPRFTQPPPAYGGGLGFGGSSGPGCGGGDFWAELAQFGIFPTSNSTLSTNSTTRSFNQSSGRLATSPTFGSPIASDNFLSGGGNTTSMLPTPHSPSPLLQNNRVASTHFAFPPTNFWAPTSGNGFQRRNNAE